MRAIQKKTLRTFVSPNALSSKNRNIFVLLPGTTEISKTKNGNTCGHDTESHP